MRDEVTRLNREIERLDSEIAALKSSGGGAQGAGSGETYVDGLYFSRAGYVSSKLKRAEDQEYKYDAHGRLIETVSKSSSDNNISKSSYEYSGKEVTLTITYIYDPDIYPDIPNSSTRFKYEYY